MIKKVFLQPNFELTDVLNEINDFISSVDRPVIIITGPTSSGKTDLAHKLYSSFKSLLISADSRQIYKETTIGSNKPEISDKFIMDGFNTSLIKENESSILYWNMDILSLKEDYSAQKYREETRSMIHTLHSINILPVLVGGTIHWIRSLTSDTISPFYVPDEKLYKELCSLPLDELQNKYLENYSREEINESDWNNTRRLSRAIEYRLITGKSLYDSTKKVDDKNNYLVFQIKIDRLPHRDKIRNSIKLRIEKGWIEEVQNILKEYPENILDKLGQGYRIIGNYILNGENLSLEDLVEKITVAEMRYAKKQIF